MEQRLTLAGTLARLMRGPPAYTPGLLSKLSGVPKMTIVNWLNGRVARPRRWQDLVRLADALRIDAEQASALLVAGGHPALAELLPRVRASEDVALLAPWRETKPVPLAPSLADAAILLPISRLPYSRNPLFVGRADELRALAAVLASTDGLVPTVAVTGLGGIGKTQLVVEFAHRFGASFRGGVYWLNFAEPEQIPAQLAQCGVPGYLHLGAGSRTLSLDERVELVRAAWQLPQPRLLVFDNCEDPALLLAWRPTTGGCRVVLTSRRADWDEALAVRTVPLTVLGREESIVLVRSRLDSAPAGGSGADAATLDDIAAELGDLPLALHLAGSVLARYRHVLAPADYLHQLRSGAGVPDLSGSTGVSPTGHVAGLAPTFALSFDRLVVGDPIDRRARRALWGVAHWAPGIPIPRMLLHRLALPDEETATLVDAEEALVRLTDLGLLEPTAGGALRMHRLLAAWVRQHAPADAIAWAEQALIDVLAPLLQRQVVDELPALAPHLTQCVAMAGRRQDQRTAKLNYLLGQYLHTTGDYASARRALDRACATAEATLGPLDPLVAAILNQIGMLLTFQGAAAEARQYVERALAIRETILAPNHPDTAWSAESLGVLLAAARQETAAQAQFERALKIRETALGPDHPDTALVRINLAVLLRGLGQTANARVQLEHALGTCIRTLGEQHPRTARCLNTLGDLLLEAGDVQTAMPLLERALSVNRRTLGDKHPITAWSMASIGAARRQQGDHQAARDAFACALAVRTMALGEQHPLTIQSHLLLSEAMAALGDEAPAARAGQAWARAAGGFNRRAPCG